MGGALDRTTGKRQARALTSFIEAVNLSEKLGSQASEKDLRRDLDGGEHHSHGLLVHVPAQVRQASPKSARPWRGPQADQAASSRVVVSGKFCKSRGGEWSWYAGDVAITGSFGEDAHHDQEAG